MSQAQPVHDILRDLPALLTVPEAAHALRVSVRTVNRLLASRRLKAARVAGRVLVPRMAIGDLLAKTLT